MEKKQSQTTNPYRMCRDNLGLTREQASELLEFIPPERLERIESEKMQAHPEEILAMAAKYKAPELCNYYCAHECSVGKQYVPEIKVKDLAQIVLEMLASLNTMEKRKERLIEITADGQITGDEVEDFIHIQEDLERISITVETLQLWAEQMIANGTIDRNAYEAHKINKD